MTIEESPYKFDGEDRKFLLREPPQSLNSKTVPSEQYDYFDYADPEMDGFDGFDRVRNTLSRLIGTCMILFSELETQVGVNLHELINNRSHQQGCMITRNMSYRQKVDLYIDYLRSLTLDIYESSLPDTYIHDVDLLKKHLYKAGELRNIVAHASVKHFKDYIQELNQALKNIDQDELVNFVNLINEARVNKKRVFIVGNGGSASTASR